MQFNGFEVYPCGNSVLSTANGVLTVSGISNTGLDGVLIKIDSADNYVVNFGTMPSIAQNNGVLKCTSLAKNAFGQVTSTFETLKWYDPINNKIIVGVNSNYLPNSYNIFGKLNGVTVFDINNNDITISPDPNFPPAETSPIETWNLIIAVARIAVEVYNMLHTKTSTVTTYQYDANGNLIGRTVVQTEDPIPFDIEINGSVYTITEYGYMYNVSLPPELIGCPSVESHAIGEQITGVNLSSFTITSIQAI